MKVLVGWSGGKDSQASLIWAANKYGADKVEACFCDTGWENPITYLHVIDVCQQLGVKLVILKSKKYNGMIDLAEKKGRFPSAKARFCTEELKTKPMIDYILKQTVHCIIVQGIRSDESESRSKMNAQCTYFKYYFQSVTDNIIKIKALRKKLRKGAANHKQKLKYQKLRAKLNKGILEEKYHTYRKKDVINWLKLYSDDVMRPYFNATGSDVMNDIISAGYKPNQLYYKGRKRVGCDPCMMSNHTEVKAAVRFTPETIARLRMAEKQLGGSFFGPGYIPDRFCTGLDDKGNVFPWIDDVINYLTGGDYQPELFQETEQESHRCMSFYGICE